MAQKNRGQLYARLRFIGLLLVVSPCLSIGQSCKTDAPLISTGIAYLASVKADPAKQMVALQPLIPGLALDIRYATVGNFTGTILYHEPFVCLRKEPAEALKRVQSELNKKGLGLKIYDAYRPFSVTCHIWRLVPDRRYAANPRKGSNHNRGLALDLTIIDIRTGKELDMGTAFDDFTDSAHHNFTQLPPAVLANRRLMKTVMRKYGFDIVPDEWWHYQWKDRQKYELLDLPFADIRALIKG